MMRVTATGLAAAGANLIWYSGYLPIIEGHAPSLSFTTVAAVLVFSLLLALPIDRFIQ